MKKRPITITTPEISAIFFAIGFLLMVFGLNEMMKINNWAVYNGMQGLSGSVMITLMIFIIMFVFFLIAVVFPNYQIVKNNLFIFIDRITNPDWMGWFGFNRNKKFFAELVDVGSFGKTKGTMADENADVINMGDYTVTTPNGNQALIVNDMLSTNINLNNAVSWNLIRKHFSVVGYKAYEMAANDGKLMFDYLEENKKPIKKRDAKEVVLDG